MTSPVRIAKRSTSLAMRSYPLLIVAASIVSVADEEWSNGTQLWNLAIGSYKDPTQSIHGDASAYVLEEDRATRKSLGSNSPSQIGS